MYPWEGGLGHVEREDSLLRAVDAELKGLAERCPTEIMVRGCIENIFQHICHLTNSLHQDDLGSQGIGCW